MDSVQQKKKIKLWGSWDRKKMLEESLVVKVLGSTCLCSTAAHKV